MQERAASSPEIRAQISQTKEDKSTPTSTGNHRAYNERRRQRVCGYPTEPRQSMGKHKDQRHLQ